MTTVAQRDHPTALPHWWWFALFSLALHMVLLLEWTDIRIAQLGGDHSAPIAVTLLAKPFQQPQTKQENSKSKQPDQSSETLKMEQKSRPEVPAKRPTLATLKSTYSAKTADHETTEEPIQDVHLKIQKPLRKPAVDSAKAQKPQIVTTSTPLSSPPLTEQRLLSEIKIEFSRYFRYPPRALRKQLEGKVILSFRLDSTGTIQSIVVAKSSGHGILDRAAIKSLSKIAPLTGSPRSGISFELPVIYRIHNS